MHLKQGLNNLKYAFLENCQFISPKGNTKNDPHYNTILGDWQIINQPHGPTDLVVSSSVPPIIPPVQYSTTVTVCFWLSSAHTDT